MGLINRPQSGYKEKDLIFDEMSKQFKMTIYIPLLSQLKQFRLDIRAL
jgi:hypothetical protein